jgi:plasmid stabilization system protein ParE
VPASNVVVDFSPAARADLRGAVDWYEDKAGLGESIRSAVLNATNRIAMAPKRWPVRRGTHRYVMRRLPYTIAYLTDGATVKIVAVAHHSLDLASWENRR